MIGNVYRMNTNINFEWGLLNELVQNTPVRQLVEPMSVPQTTKSEIKAKAPERSEELRKEAQAEQIRQDRVNSSFRKHQPLPSPVLKTERKEVGKPSKRQPLPRPTQYSPCPRPVKHAPLPAPVTVAQKTTAAKAAKREQVRLENMRNRAISALVVKGYTYTEAFSMVSSVVKAQAQVQEAKALTPVQSKPQPRKWSTRMDKPTVKPQEHKVGKRAKTVKIELPTEQRKEAFKKAAKKCGLTLEKGWHEYSVEVSRKVWENLKKAGFPKVLNTVTTHDIYCCEPSGFKKGRKNKSNKSSKKVNK